MEDGEIDSDSNSTKHTNDFSSQASSQNSQHSVQSTKSSVHSAVSSSTTSVTSTAPMAVIRSASKESCSSQVTITSEPPGLSSSSSQSGVQPLFSGPEISDMSQDSRTMAWHKEDKLREHNKENIPEALRLELNSKIENKAKIETFSNEKTPNKPPPAVSGSSKRKSQTPMKLTADRNEAPPKKKKKLRRKSKDKKSQAESPRRLLVDKNSDDTSPNSEDSRPPNNPFVYKVKSSEPHSPFSGTSNKSTEFNETAELQIEAETDARSSFFDQTSYFQNNSTSTPEVKLPDDPQERIKFLGLEMTADTTFFKHNKSGSPTAADKTADLGALGLLMSDTKLSAPSRSNSPTQFLVNDHSPKNDTRRVAKRNIFNIETQNPIVKWARNLKAVLVEPKMNRHFLSQPVKFLESLTNVNVDQVLQKTIEMHREISKLPESQPEQKEEQGTNEDSFSSCSSSLLDGIDTMSMPAPPKFSS